MNSQDQIYVNEHASYLCSDSDIQAIKDELSEFLQFRKNEDVNFSSSSESKVYKSNENKENHQEEPAKTSGKRKKKTEDVSQHEIFNVFLNIMYPLSMCRSKSVSVGLVNSADCLPHVIINHGVKCVSFVEASWDSFLKHLHLFECYLVNNVHGRKTAVRLADSDIEIDSIKVRGVQQIRIKDVTKFDSKVHLNQQEFLVLCASTQPVTRYLRQLTFAVPIIKDYLNASMDEQLISPLPVSPVESSIYNRLPQEVNMWREIKNIGSITHHNEMEPEIQPQIEDVEEEEDVVEVDLTKE